MSKAKEEWERFKKAAFKTLLRAIERAMAEGHSSVCVRRGEWSSCNNPQADRLSHYFERELAKISDIFECREDCGHCPDCECDEESQGCTLLIIVTW
jgi:hypothetical protein